MESLGPPLIDPQIRFLFDNVVDGVKDGSLLIWQTLDTKSNQVAWVLGRRINETTVLPVAVLANDPVEIVRRYAPALGNGNFDYSQVPGKIITPGI